MEDLKLTNETTNEKERPLVQSSNIDNSKRSSLVTKTPAFYTKSLSRYCSMKNITYNKDMINGKEKDKDNRAVSQNFNTCSEVIQNNISTNPKSDNSTNLIEKNTFGDKFIMNIHQIQQNTNGLITELKANHLRLSLQINNKYSCMKKNKKAMVISQYPMNVIKLEPISVKDKDKDILQHKQSSSLPQKRRELVLSAKENLNDDIIDKDRITVKDNSNIKTNPLHKTQNFFKLNKDIPIDLDNEDIFNTENNNNDTNKDINPKDKDNKNKKEEEKEPVKINTFHRKRILTLSNTEIFKKSQKVYFIPIKLAQAKGSFHDFDLQVAAISDQLKLISFNNQKLKTEYLYTSNFMKAFTNLNPFDKTKYNKHLENTIAIMISTVPKILKKVYNSLDQILYCRQPNASLEEKKTPYSEDECLILNIKWCHEVSTYFTACKEIFEVIKTKKAILFFTETEFFGIKVYLDSLRFNVNNLISTAKMYIDKYFNEQKLLSSFEEGCKLRPKRKEVKEVDIFDRIFQGQKTTVKNKTNAKIREINAIFDREGRRYKSTKSVDVTALALADRYLTGADKDTPMLSDIGTKLKIKGKTPYYLNYYDSLINKPLISVLMKYYTKETRDKIIANRIVERFRHNELKELMPSPFK